MPESLVITQLKYEFDSSKTLGFESNAGYNSTPPLIGQFDLREKIIESQNNEIIKHESETMKPKIVIKTFTIPTPSDT